MSHPECSCAPLRLHASSPNVPNYTLGRISWVFPLPAQSPRTLVRGHLSRLWCVRILLLLEQTILVSTDPSYAPDFFAFSLMIFLTMVIKKTRGSLPNILKSMAEDSALYFLVIFTSHFVLEMTMGLGRVSVTFSPLSTQPITSNMSSPQPSIQLLPAT